MVNRDKTGWDKKYMAVIVGFKKKISQSKTSKTILHCAKYRKFTQFSDVEILWKRTVSEQFRANHPKLCGNCAFPQNFHASKSGEITVFYAVLILIFFSENDQLFNPSCLYHCEKYRNFT